MQTIRTLLRVSGIALALVLSTTASRAQIASINDLDIYVELEESGYGAIYGAAPLTGADPYVLTPALATDPLSGVATLSWLQSWQTVTVTYGDVVLTEADGTISDVIRFAPSPDGQRIFFFSDNSDGAEPGNLADVGVLTSFQNNHVILPEGPVENGVDGLLYVPTPGQPGFSELISQTFGRSFGYNIISDVPEPAAVALLGLGGLFVVLRKRL